jgi:hypothetical protein
LQYSNEIKKNSVPLKEELTRRRANTSRGSATMRMRAHVTMREKPALSASAFLKIAGNACVAVISVIHVRRVRCAMKARTSRATWLTALHTDSESQILQGKYFSCSPACSLGKRAPNVAVVANHRLSIRNTHSTSRVSHSIALR